VQIICFAKNIQNYSVFVWFFALFHKQKLIRFVSPTKKWFVFFSKTKTNQIIICFDSILYSIGQTYHFA
jgi:hypothetical protein